MSHMLTVVAVAMLAVGINAFAPPGSVGLLARAGARDVGSADVDAVLWRADHDSGDLSDWFQGDCGGDFSNGAAYVEYSGEIQNRSGVMRMRVPNMNTGRSQGARAFRWCEAQEHRALYYSAWYYIPATVRVDGWWWLMEWKSEGSFNAKFGLAVGNRRNGQMYVYLERGRDSGGGTWEQSVKDLPSRQWVHLEAYYEKATDASGHVIVWQDGEKIIDVANVPTANSADLSWAVINYGQNTRPSDVAIYVDDAKISTRRLGP